MQHTRLEKNQSGSLFQTGTTETDTNTAIDETVINELFRLITATEKRALLLQAFENTGKGHIAQLARTANAQNSKDYLLRIHSFKGGAATLGVQSITSLCHEIEGIGLAIAHDEMLAYNIKLERAFKQSKAFLEAYL